MPLQRILASVPGLLPVPVAVYAQTEEIQREVEAKLWIQRVLSKIQYATGAPPVVSSVFLIALAVALLGTCLWLWRLWRKRATQ
jgi:hypothetical protein